MISFAAQLDGKDFVQDGDDGRVVRLVLSNGPNEAPRVMATTVLSS
ncbi:MAG: hypothetical protein WBV82_03925 [Myxococcaceae bacterium]